MYQSVRSLILSAALSAAVGGATAASEAVGPVALTDGDGREVVIRNFEERPATVIVFLSSRCAATERMLDAISRLYEKYRLREVLYVGVCSGGVESADELQEFAHKRGLIFAVYQDVDSKVAEQMEVRATPEVRLLNREGQLVYRGGLDQDSGVAGLETAIRQILSGAAVDVASVPAKGTPIDQPGAPIQRVDPYGAPAFSSELIFDHLPGVPAHHCSTITEAPNGDLLCLWYGGSYESADDQKLILSRRRPGERVWSEAEVLVENHRTPPGNAVIFVDGRGRLQIVWGRMDSTRPIRRGGGWGKCRLFVRTSTDSGQSWSEDRPLQTNNDPTAADGVFGVPRNPPAKLADGTMILSMEGHGGGVFLLSSSGGETWVRGGTAAKGSQPAVIQRRDGSLLTLMRSYPRITSAMSADGGKTWSPTTETALRNPGSGISMVQLANGHLVLVFNDSTTDRTPLSLVRSTDEGRTWGQPMHLESNPGEYSYPCVIQTADGRIHVTYTFRRYTIKHVELNEDWIVQLERPN